MRVHLFWHAFHHLVIRHTHTQQCCHELLDMWFTSLQLLMVFRGLDMHENIVCAHCARSDWQDYKPAMLSQKTCQKVMQLQLLSTSV